MDYMTMNFNRNGGSGTSDYSQLSNKPSINDVTLSGNKTSADLGLMPAYEVDTTPTESSENLITSGGVWNADKNIKDKLQGSKTAGSTDGSPFEIPDYGMTESIQMYFKPTQDLHGYDKPWAGGAGKNKLKLEFESDVPTVAGMTFAHTESELSINGTATNTYHIFTLTNVPTMEVGTNYMLSADIEGSLGSSLVTVSFLSNGQVIQRVSLSEIQQTAGIRLESACDTARFILEGFDVGSSYNYSAKIMLEQGSTATDFEPYSNICPISGQDNATFSWTDSHDIENEVTMNFGNTYYGGFCQFNGQIYPEWDYIASYNGETLSGEWVSDRDEYQAGTTPTIGAEVAYKTTPTYARVTPPANLNLTDDYPIEYNGYMANISYQPKNTVLAEAKRYTNQEIAKLGLPQPPTTDGTYHLECSVSGGIPTIRWVSNS